MQMGELLEGEPARPAEGLPFPSKLKYPFFLQREGVSQGGIQALSVVLVIYS